MTSIYNLKTSTITCLVSTNISFILDKLFNSIKSYIIKESSGETISYVEHNGKLFGTKIEKKAKSSKNPFQPHQVAVAVHLTNREIKLMIFKSRIKICGCTSSNDAINVVAFLWDKCIDSTCYNSINGLEDQDVSFTFEEVMINKPFILPFVISKINFNILMNIKHLNEVVCFMDIMQHNYVNLTIASKCSDKCLLVLKVTKDKEFLLSTMTLTKGEEKGTTFMIYDKKVIISGRNIHSMERDYKFVRDFILSNKETLSI